MACRRFRRLASCIARMSCSDAPWPPPCARCETRVTFSLTESVAMKRMCVTKPRLRASCVWVTAAVVRKRRFDSKRAALLDVLLHELFARLRYGLAYVTRNGAVAALNLGAAIVDIERIDAECVDREVGGLAAEARARFRAGSSRRLVRERALRSRAEGEL